MTMTLIIVEYTRKQNNNDKVLIHSGSVQHLIQIHDDIMCNGNKECRLG